MKSNSKVKEYLFDILTAVAAGVIVGTAYHFFQNSNGFAPGGVGAWLPLLTTCLGEG